MRRASIALIFIGLFQFVANAQDALSEATQRIEQGRFREALAATEQVPPDASDALRARLLLMRGRAFALLISEQEAITAFETALPLAIPTDPALSQIIKGQLGLLKKEKATIAESLAYFSQQPQPDRRAIAEMQLAAANLMLRQQKADTSTLTLLQSASAHLEETKQGNTSLAGKVLQSLGYYHWKIGANPSLGLQYSEQAERIYIAIGGTQSNHLAALYINLGGCIDDLGRPRAAVDIYEKAEKNLLEQHKSHPFLVNLYNNMGTSYRDLGEFTASLRCLENAVALLPDEGRYWNNLGETYRSLNNFVVAEKCYEKSIRLLENLAKPPPFQLARPYHNLAVLYLQKGDPARALGLDLRSIPLRRSNPNAHLDIARSYLGTGECYLALKDFSKAAAYLDTALLLQKNAIPSMVFGECASVFLAKSRIAAAKSQWDLALVMVDSALYATGLIRGNGWSDVIAPQEMLAAMGQKADIFYKKFHSTGSVGDLSKSGETYDLAAAALRYFRNTLLHSASKSSFLSQFNSLLSGGFETALLQHTKTPDGNRHLETAFRMIEQSKALSLLEGVRNTGPVKFEGVPDEILAQERALLLSITEVEVALKKALDRNVKKDSEAYKALIASRFEIQRKFERFQQTLASGQYAQYFNYRYGYELATLQTVQQQLLDAPNSVFATYFTGASGLISAIIVDKSGIRTAVCGDTAQLSASAEKLRRGISGYYSLPPSKRTEAMFEQTLNWYIASGQALYSQLVAPLGIAPGSEVVIAPDGMMAALPFEAFLKAPTSDLLNFGAYPYWASTQQCAVSYVFSASLWREMKQKKHRQSPTKNILAMAPFSSTPLTGPGGKKFKVLPFSGDESQQICMLWGGKTQIGAAATLHSFLEEAEQYRMLHLSTHGMLDSTPEFSYLSFAPAGNSSEVTPLYVRDLYNVQLNADLVSLSACETGIGQFQQGEGIISLGRAFAYAGAKSIVTSLWPVDNAATKNVMTTFYRDLKDGKNKSKSLAAAKSAQISQSESSEQQHPFFWAGLIILGDISSVK